MDKITRSGPAAPAVGIPVERMVRPGAEARHLVERLRLHDDERLYEEADLLMSEAADEIERQRNNADNLRQQVDDLTAEIQRLRAALEVSQAATNAAISKAQFQASTNAELNALHDQVRRLKAEACRRLNDEFGA